MPTSRANILRHGEKHAYVVPYKGLPDLHDRIPTRKNRQTKNRSRYNEHSFARELSRARTFGFLKDVEAMRAKGLCSWRRLDNAVVWTTKYLNPEGLRFSDEFVRHKALDALGDLVP